jgi:hypothetical protein
MTTLAICRPRPDADMSTFTEHLAAEGEALRRLAQRGLLCDAYSPGRPGAVLILDTDTDTAARLLAELPLAAAGMLDIELIPLTPLPF